MRARASLSPCVEARGLRKTYGRGATAFEALKGIDLVLLPGEVVMLVGPSGSGKTTLLSILGCVLSPTAGDLSILGKPVAHATPRELADVRLRQIGFVFQGFNLLEALTALQNVALPLELVGRPRPESKQVAFELLQQVGLAEKSDAFPSDLSGGQRQRVAVARALALSPPIVLADEPTASLDATTGLRVVEMLRELATKRGAALFIVSHDPRILHVAERTVHIEDGMLASDARERVFESATHKTWEALP